MWRRALPAPAPSIEAPFVPCQAGRAALLPNGPCRPPQPPQRGPGLFHRARIDPSLVRPEIPLLVTRTRFVQRMARFVTPMARRPAPGPRLPSRHPATDLTRGASVIQVASDHARDDALSSTAPADTRDLRWIASAFEAAQAQRLRTGEQIRAFVKSGADGHGLPGGRVPDIDALLASLRAGAAPASLAALGDAYRREWADERELLRLMSERLAH